MADNWNFDPVLFIEDGPQTTIDPKATPYLYNNNGVVAPVATPQGTKIVPKPDDPSIYKGTLYRGISATDDTSHSYPLTVFDFHVDLVVYEPMWADADAAHAFGMTLFPNGCSIDFTYEHMISAKYTYGAFAGYESPYLSGRTRELLPINATDLEYHNFAHVFCSQDTIPLVISVARYRKDRREISLADLWVRPGDALFVPPKTFSSEYVDIHGNRNSAQACWGNTAHSNIATQTILGDTFLFDQDSTRPHYHEEKHPTLHTAPSGWKPE